MEQLGFQLGAHSVNEDWFGRSPYRYIYLFAMIPIDQFSEEDRADIIAEVNYAYTKLPMPTGKMSAGKTIGPIQPEWDLLPVPFAFAHRAGGKYPEETDAVWELFKDAHNIVSYILDQYDPESPITRRGKFLEHDDFVPEELPETKPKREAREWSAAVDKMMKNDEPKKNPAKWVKDDDIWEKAKQQAVKQAGKPTRWALVNFLYFKLGGRKK